MAFEEAIRAIVDDRQHGSSVLLNRIQVALRNRSDGASAEQLRWAFRRLRRIDPSMVVVHHFLDALEPTIGADFQQALADYETRWQNVHLAVADNLLALMDDRPTAVLTHSHSGLLIRVATELAKRDRPLTFWQTRSQPGNEGDLQCRALQDAGYNVRLVEDEDIGRLVPHMDCAWLGVDQYDARGFVNKIGSRSIVERFDAAGKTTFVLGDSRKRVGVPHHSDRLFEYTLFTPRVRLVTEQRD